MVVRHHLHRNRRRIFISSLNGLKFGISAKGRTVRLRSHGSLSPVQFEAVRRVGSYECVSTESGEVQIELGYEQFGQHSFTTKGKFMSNYPSIPPANIESKRIVCGVLAILLGGLSIHRFILGDVGGGIIRILITVVTCGVGGLIGLVEGIIYLTKSDAEFIATYQIGKKSWF